MLAAAGLAVRMVWLLRHPDLATARAAERQQRRVIPTPGRPGSLLGRSAQHYVPLAVSRQVPSCFADPLLIEDNQLAEVSIAVGRILQRDARDIQQTLIQRRSKRFVWLQRRISESQAEAIEQLHFRGVGIVPEWTRDYPSGSLAATVLGFRRIDGVPGGGLELTQDRFLTGADGRRVVLIDARRRPIGPLPAESCPPQDGGSVFLCLDAVIQDYLQQAVTDSLQQFSGQWGVGVVADPQTGAILAMCSLPGYDPNAYNTADAATMTNRVVTTPFEPGSIFKPLITAGAVEAGAVRYEDKIFCENGVYRAHRGGRITDHGESHGPLSVADGVILSSNICLAKVGEKLGNNQIHEIVRRFGFGESTGVELPGESGGIVRALAKWDGYSLRRVPFGQEISATALQLTMAFCSLANGGVLLKPYLVDTIADAEGRVIYRGGRRVVRRVISPPVAAQTLAVMQQVVEQGTGKPCRMSRWTCFGKTGTAQIAGQGGYVPDAYVGSFLGGAPVNHPRLVCLISIYHPVKSKGYYGSKVAAPFVKEVLQRSLTYLGVPDDCDETLLVHR